MYVELWSRFGLGLWLRVGSEVGIGLEVGLDVGLETGLEIGSAFGLGTSLGLRLGLGLSNSPECSRVTHPAIYSGHSRPCNIGIVSC